MRSVLHTWNHIESLFASAGVLPMLALAPPAREEEIRDLELHLGLALPQSFKDLLGCQNGQAASAECGLFFGDDFLSVQGIRMHWDNWRSLADDGLNEAFASSMSSRPPGVIKPQYVN